MFNSQVIKETENFCIAVEEREGILFVHVEVENYSKGVHKEMKGVMEDLGREAWILGWDEIYAYTPNPKFCKMMCDCKEIGEIEDHNVKVMVWQLEPQL